jgi:CTP-dependent riboflavin kinase
MSRKVIFALILFAFAIIAAFIVWKWTFRKSELNVSSKKATIEIEASILTHAYENDEEASNARYLGKVISVSGTVNSITDEGQNILVYLKNYEDISGVMCSFNKAVFEANSVQTGDRVKIKGLCAGYLLDVQLTKCSTEP